MPNFFIISFRISFFSIWPTPTHTCNDKLSLNINLLKLSQFTITINMNAIILFGASPHLPRPSRFIKILANWVFVPFKCPKIKYHNSISRLHASHNHSQSIYVYLFAKCITAQYHACDDFDQQHIVHVQCAYISRWGINREKYPPLCTLILCWRMIPLSFRFCVILPTPHISHLISSHQLKVISRIKQIRNSNNNKYINFTLHTIIFWFLWFRYYQQKWGEKKWNKCHVIIMLYCGAAATASVLVRCLVLHNISPHMIAAISCIVYIEIEKRKWNEWMN